MLAEHSPNPADMQQYHRHKYIKLHHHCILVSCKPSTTPMITADVTELQEYGWRVPVQAAWTAANSPDSGMQKVQQHTRKVRTRMLSCRRVARPIRPVQSSHSPAMCNCRGALTGDVGQYCPGTCGPAQQTVTWGNKTLDGWTPEKAACLDAAPCA